MRNVRSIISTWPYLEILKFFFIHTIYLDSSFIQISCPYVDKNKIVRQRHRLEPPLRSATSATSFSARAKVVVVARTVPPNHCRFNVNAHVPARKNSHVLTTSISILFAWVCVKLSAIIGVKKPAVYGTI